MCKDLFDFTSVQDGCRSSQNGDCSRFFFIFTSRTVVFVLSKCDSSKEKDAGHVTKMLLSNDIFLKS